MSKDKKDQPQVVLSRVIEVRQTYNLPEKCPNCGVACTSKNAYHVVQYTPETQNLWVSDDKQLEWGDVHPIQADDWMQTEVICNTCQTVLLAAVMAQVEEEEDLNKTLREVLRESEESWEFTIAF